MEHRDLREDNSPLCPGFRQACQDQLYLAERGYPLKQTVKLVGDRYQLTSVQRSVLMRGLIPPHIACLRRSKLLRPGKVSGCELWVDTCNVIVALGNYLCGKYLYVATDGLLRDAAESRGVFRNDRIRKQAAGLVISSLAGLSAEKLVLCIDAPLTHSRDLACELRDAFSDKAMEARVILVNHADEVLKQAPGIVSSGDSEIIDSVERVFDLTRFTLEEKRGAEFPDLAEYLFSDGREALRGKEAE